MASINPRVQPPWAQPQGKPEHSITVFNSLTNSKVPFIPRDGNRVTWYACGPTVYDDSHLGHARNYVTTDILRRILRDYFKFDLRFVMNITDVDDKIILRGRQQHLYEEWKAQHRYIQAEERQMVLSAYYFYIKKNLPLIGQKTPPPLPERFKQDIETEYGRVLRGQALDNDGKPGDREAKINMHINTAMSAVRALTTDPKNLTPYAFYDMVSDVMCTMLDNNFGHTIKGSDHAIFTKLTKEFEHRFFRDMKDLNVLEPDEIVRVTEHGEQISRFVDRIVKNKFAYATSDGSVYFDIKAFEAAGNPYARLEPWNRGDTSLQADGEGALIQKTNEKRSDADFALWKASKPGEPSWDSPWGPGRPGWHIECSAMASDKLGKQMDIHSGGIDLAFPHHDNELAQSEAFWQDEYKSQWVNYFLHMGHLSIQGSKMSKSLKNFTTIRTALERKDWTSRSLRIVFLLGSWRAGIEITDDLVLAGASWEDKVDNFFLLTREILKAPRSTRNMSLGNFSKDLQDAEQKVYEALCDSFNTPVAMAIISSLITKFNSMDRSTMNMRDVRDTAFFVTKMVNIFGLNGAASAEPTDVGWRGIDIPDIAKQYVYPLAAMRDELRQAAIAKTISPETVEKIMNDYPHATDAAATNDPRRSMQYANILEGFRKSAIAASSGPEMQQTQQQPNGESERQTAAKDPSKEILALCDRVRDVDLWGVNIYLEDREGERALVRPVTAGLRHTRREKEERARAKHEARVKRDRDAKEKLEKGRLSHLDMFKAPHSSEFSAWDANGIPTLMAGGEEVPKSRVKKLLKDAERQKKAHELYQAWLASEKEGRMKTEAENTSASAATGEAHDH